MSETDAYHVYAAEVHCPTCHAKDVVMSNIRDRKSEDQRGYAARWRTADTVEKRMVWSAHARYTDEGRLARIDYEHHPDKYSDT